MAGPDPLFAVFSNGTGFSAWLFSCSVYGCWERRYSGLSKARRIPEEFGNLPTAFWNIAVYLLSGLDTAMPRTFIGRGVVDRHVDPRRGDRRRYYRGHCIDTGGTQNRKEKAHAEL